MQTEHLPNFHHAKTCHASVSLDLLAQNLSFLQSQSPEAEITAMVKANAYGHGLVKISQFLQEKGVRQFGVSTLEEGWTLRKEGICQTILVMAGSGFIENTEILFEAQLTPLISSLEEIHILIDVAKKKKGKHPFKIHLDLDTGMSRGGVLVGNDAHKILKPFVDLLQKNKSIVQLEGIATHFSIAESPECSYSAAQLSQFIKAIQFLDDSGFSQTVLHTDKSSAILTRTGIHADPRNRLQRRIWIRPGISLYGINPLGPKNPISELKPILSWRTPITIRKTIPKGTPVGYNNTWIAKEETEIAILRVGYGDGYSRQLSNQGHVLICQERAPIIGRVSMDLTVVDVTEIIRKHGEKSCSLGTLATLIGKEGSEEISAQDLGNLCQTIPYEILTNISARVPRLYV